MSSSTVFHSAELLETRIFLEESTLSRRNRKQTRKRGYRAPGGFDRIRSKLDRGSRGLCRRRVQQDRARVI